MTTDGQASESEIKPRTKATRRRNDKALVGALGGLCAFLAVVVFIQGAYLFKVVDDVDDQQHSLTKFVCFQNNAFHSALERERKLIKTGPPEQRPAHIKSAAQLQGYLKTIDTIVDCSGIKFSKPEPLSN